MRRACAAVLLVVVVAAACGGSGGGDGAATSTTAPGGATTSAPATTATTAPAPGPLEGITVTLTELADLESATAMTVRAGDTAIYVTTREGQVKVLRQKPDSDPPTYTVDRTPFVDISDDVEAGGEQGLLGIAFSSDGRQVYLAYTRSEDERQQVDEFTLNGDKVDTRSRRTIIQIEDFAPNHNGGDLQLGPDGYLYYGMGDGGGGGDPERTGQDPSDLLGDILRIDPQGRSDTQAYAVPSDNPFADGGGAPEVWAYGLRNPWRFSFDRETGDLWIADVGQGEWEEIDFLPAADGAGRGANLGWNGKEGTHTYDDSVDVAGAVDPIYEYDHDGGGCSVTGGYVYRGSRIPDLVGAYVFGDYCKGDLMALVQDGGSVVAQAPLGLHVDGLSSFGEDADGELYALGLGGQVYRLDP